MDVRVSKIWKYFELFVSLARRSPQSEMIGALEQGLCLLKESLACMHVAD
jgi:hypothetical protein